MKPNWRKFFIGILIVFLAYIIFLIFAVKSQLLVMLRSLPENQVSLYGLIITISIMTLFSILGFLLSKKKRRSPIRWMILCFFLNVWAFIYLWSLPDLHNET